jgi:hypothetical protein
MTGSAAYGAQPVVRGLRADAEVFARHASACGEAAVVVAGGIAVVERVGNGAGVMRPLSAFAGVGA